MGLFCLYKKKGGLAWWGGGFFPMEFRDWCLFDGEPKSNKILRLVLSCMEKIVGLAFGGKLVIWGSEVRKDF